MVLSERFLYMTSHDSALLNPQLTKTVIWSKKGFAAS